MIEVQTVLELAKEMPPNKVARKTGYTTAQVHQMLKRHNQKPFDATVNQHKHRPRVNGEARKMMIMKINMLIQRKAETGESTAMAIHKLQLGISEANANKWIRFVRDGAS